MTFKSFAAAAIVASSFVVPAASAGWIDWTSTTAGTMTIGSTTVGVSLTGSPLDKIDGDYYYNNANTGGVAPTGTYAGLAPTDLIRVNTPSTFTLTFDQSVSDLYMSLVSVGQPNLAVNYTFSDSFSVHSFGSNYWGYNGYTQSGSTFTGTEFNGVLKFAGDFNAITFSTNPNEFWHGFNFASFETSLVPEPGSALLLSLGLLGLVASRKRST